MFHTYKPLALELPAAQTRSVSIERIAARLGQHPGMLAPGNRTNEPRHQTLTAAFDWSYKLLSTGEQALFRHLSVFLGGWTLEAAEVVERDSVIDKLASLVDKSLVQVEDEGANLRYRFLEPVRQYAAHLLQELGEDDKYHRRHVEWCVALAEEAEPHLWGSAQWWWAKCLERELENLRAALAWCRLTDDRAELGVRLAGGLWHFWDLMGHLREAHALLGSFVKPNSICSEAWVKVRATFGWMPFLMGEGQPHEEALTESLQLSQKLGLPRFASSSLSGLAVARLVRDDVEGAMRLQGEALTVARQAKERVETWIALWVGAVIARKLGDYATGVARLEEARGIAVELGDDWGSGRVEATLARLSIECEDYQRAEVLCQGRLRPGTDGPDHHALFALEALGWIAAARGLTERATRLLACAHAARERTGVELYLDDRDAHDHALETARGLAGSRFTTLWEQASTMTMGELVEYAQAPSVSHTATTPVSPVPPSGEISAVSESASLPDGLTPREAEVLRLIALGYSNREIALALVLSVRTVERHVTNLYAKIDARGKADATGYAFRHGLLGP